MDKKTNPTSYRFSRIARRLLVRLSDHLGITQVAVIELALRRLAQTENLLAQDDGREPEGRYDRDA